jgi:hypothetical protein
MTVRIVASVGLSALMLFSLAGCGGDTPSGADAAAEAKPVTKPAQLVGTWYRETDGPFTGFEFTKDGTVIMTATLGAASGSQTMRYSVLDGGRVSLVAPDGGTVIFGAGTAGDRLALSNDQIFGTGKTLAFRRLAAGQTLQQAAAAERAAAEQARRERLAAEAQARKALLASLDGLLAQPKLAVAGTGATSDENRIALTLKGGNGAWSGTALIEGDVVLERQVQAALQSPSGQDQPFRLAVQLGPVVGPPGSPQVDAEAMTFIVQGDPAKPDLQSGDRRLAANAAAFDELSNRYEATVAEREAVIDAFLARFGSFSELDGTLRDASRPNAAPQTMVLGVLRVEGKPVLLWADMGRDSNPAPDAFTQSATVVLDGDKPWLNIGGVGVLEAVTVGGKTTLQGKVQNREAVFEFAHKLSKDALIERQAAVTAFLSQGLAAGVGLSGAYIENNLPSSPIWPVHFDLKGDGNGKLSGDYLDLASGTKFPITGTTTATLLGARIAIQSGPGVDYFGRRMKSPGPSFVFDVDWGGRVEQRSFTPVLRGPSAVLKTEWQAGEPAFVGTMPGRSTGNRFDLFVISPERLQSDHKRIDTLLAGGLTFDNGLPFGADTLAPRVIKLEADSSAGAVAVSMSYQKRGEAPATAKELEENGFVVFQIDQPSVPSRNIPEAKIELWTFPEAEGLLLTGFAQYGNENPPRVVKLKGFWAATP